MCNNKHIKTLYLEQKDKMIICSYACMLWMFCYCYHLLSCTKTSNFDSLQNADSGLFKAIAKNFGGKFI